MRAQYARGAMIACVVIAALGGGCVDLDSLVGHGDGGGASDAGADGGGPADGAGPPHDGAIDAQSPDATGDGSGEAGDATSEPAPAETGPSGPPWWDTKYASRERLTVTDDAAQSIPAGFQVGWAADVQSLATASGSYDEVRLARWDAGTSAWTEIARVIDELGAHHEWVWARIAVPIAGNGSDASYYLYFGDSSPSAAPNDPSTVFDFYDPLDQGTLGAAWKTQGGFTMTGSELRLDTNQYAITTQTWGPGSAVDFVLRDPVYAGRFWAGFQLPGTFADDSPWVVWIARNVASPAEIWPELTLDGATIWTGAHATLPTAAVLYGVDWLGDRALYRVADAVQSTGTPTAPYTDPLCVRMTNESASPIYVSDVRVRQAVYPTPTVATGPVEPQ
ncbi:MAG: hypothetical protein ACRELB_08675 [Polyangiaceae bacterium]